MNEQNVSQSNEPTQSSKNVWITIIAVIITAVIVGGGVYAWQKSNLKSVERSLQQQISDLQSQIEQLQEELTKQNQQIQGPIENNHNINQQEARDIDLARESLINYFELLNKKQYNEATKYHGSGYEVLRDWNPIVDENNYAVLLKNGCEMNGLQCLKIKTILEQQQISATEFKFVVQFANNDGSPFKSGPCCGATEETMPTETDFEFVVKKTDSSYLVTTQPLYVP